MKKLAPIYAVCYLIAISFTVKAQDGGYQQRVQQYITQYKDIAIAEMNRTGVPASITLGQGIIETDAGKSPLATDANNHFGIKCHENWSGETYTYDDDEKGECFRKYKSADESFKDHSDFLKTHDRYSSLFKLDMTDYKDWAKGLKSCGYATNPKYADILITTIETNNLQQFDGGAQNNDYAKSNVSLTKDSAKTGAAIQQKQDPGTDAIVSDIHAGSGAGRVFLLNNIKTLEVKPGETLPKIAADYDISMKRLLKYNDMSEKSVVKPGNKIYLQPKRRNGNEAYHTVANGETMFLIAQAHGIRLMDLYTKNKIEPGTEPAPGEIIYLRSDRVSPPQTTSAIAVTNNAPVTNSTQMTNNTQVTNNTPATNNVPKGEVINDDENKYYTVQKGDTLYSISKKYNVTVDDLKSRNKLNSNDISVGDKLQLY